MTQITTTKRICEHLEKYVYDRIWNEPYTEFRTYMRPGLLNKTVTVATPVTSGTSTSWVNTTTVMPISGFFSGRYSHILLPPHKSPDDLGTWLPTDSSKFFVYSIPARFFDSIKLDVQEWTLLSDYCNENCVDLHVFTKSGYFLNRGAIYLRQADMNDCMLLAIDADMVQELFGNYSEVDKILFGKYVDSDGEADNKIYTTRLTQTTIKAMATDKSLGPAWDDVDYLLYNGKLVTGDWKSVATAGAYLEGVKDDDIIGYFELGCYGSDSPYYTDTKTSPGTEKLLVHVPGIMNPDRYLITPHTCDMWLVPTEMATGKPEVNGYYITLAGNENVVHQITHNDFSINKSFIDNIAVSQGFIRYKLRVYIRLHNKKKEFVRDYNYIDMLYNLVDEYTDDTELKQFLLGTHPWQQPKPVPDVSCDYDPDLTVYWYTDIDSAIGYSCVTEIKSEAKFNDALAKHGKLYRNPFEQLLFWKADHLEDCKYANALIRKRDGRYQDPATQCSVCPNNAHCMADKEVLLEKQALGTICAWELAKLAELNSYGVGISTGGTVVCDKFVKSAANQCSICGLKKDINLSGVETTLCTIEDDTIDPPRKLGYECPYYHRRSMRDYVQILGYFHVLSLVGKHVWHFKVTKTDTYKYSILAPLALAYPELNPTDYFCLVYHNGYRVDQSRISISSTNRDNEGAEEMEHHTGCLSRSTLVIQSNFATKIMVSIDPQYEDCPDHRILEGKKYYKDDGSGKLIEANIVASKEAFDALTTREEQVAVDYIVEDLINKDKTKSYLTTKDKYFTTRVYYGKLASETDYTLLVPGETEDYQVNDSIAEFCEERAEASTVPGDTYTVYQYFPTLSTIVNEFNVGDTVCIDCLDNRQRKDSLGDDEVCVYLAPWTSTDPRTITTYTDNQYKLYKVTSDDRNGKTYYKYEKVPDADMGTLEADVSGKSFTLTINPALKTDALLFIEGPKVVEKSCTRTVKVDTFGSLGTELWSGEGPLAFPMDSAMMFMNNKRLISNLDYYLDYGDIDNIEQIFPYVQNLSYIWKGMASTKVEGETIQIDYIRACMTDISSQYGFMIGKKITWAGQAPFWFDELSTLTVDGAVCSNFKHTLGMVSVADEDHRNGAPYEIKTSCSTRVMDIVGCKDEQPGDISKIQQIRSFFETTDLLPRTEVIIPHSHKIYSTYMEAICGKYLTDTSFKFDTHKVTTDETFAAGKIYYIKQAGSLRPITDKERAAGVECKPTTDTSFKAGKAYYVLENKVYRPITSAERAAGMKTTVNYFEKKFDYYEELGSSEFEAQFSAYSYLKNMDIAYKLSRFDLGFVDVYPMYHRAYTKSRDEYNKLRYLNNKLAPVDHIKHKDATHE